MTVSKSLKYVKISLDILLNILFFDPPEQELYRATVFFRANSEILTSR